ncbi:hypothetical protein SDC9_131022 [bioreactor metagenome]|uniref:Uncharacterized protein n=1 Tax=bioreactor metagenome TaxID=1076179 RepID=A0A645D5P4_9ZZZZ
MGRWTKLKKIHAEKREMQYGRVQSFMGGKYRCESGNDGQNIQRRGLT